MKIIPITQNKNGLYYGKSLANGNNTLIPTKNESAVVTMPNFYYQPSMKANAVYKSFLPKVENNKATLLRKLQEILKTKPKDTQNIDFEFLVEYCQERVFATIEALENRMVLLYEQLKAIDENKRLNRSQQISAAMEINKQYQVISKKCERYINNIDAETKKKALEEINGTIPAEEDYDYELINKFKCAIQENNFDLDKIFHEHYAPLASIKTIEELQKKFPTIRIPQRPESVVAKKYAEVLTRNFYLKIHEFAQENDFQGIKSLILDTFIDLSDAINKKYNANNILETSAVVSSFTDAVIDNYKQLREYNKFNTVPEIKKLTVPAVTEQDIKMLSIDYDSYVLSIIKAMYLDGAKPASITYNDGDIKIKLADIKSPEYKFEKLSERIKKIISTAKEIKDGYRSYDKFSSDDFRERLSFYSENDIANNDYILETIMEFQESPLEEVDKSQVKLLLKEFDRFQDGVESIDDVINIIKSNNILPQERKILNEKVLNEQRKKQEINAKIKKINSRLEHTINLLYAKKLNSYAKICEKYKIETLENDGIDLINLISDIVEKNIVSEEGILKIKNSLLNLEAYMSEMTAETKSTNLKGAIKYGTINGALDKLKAGQYIRNAQKLACEGYGVREENSIVPIVNSCDCSTEEKIVRLCKYEDFIKSQKKDECSILDALKIFDKKDPIDKNILNYIVKNDYVSKNTTIYITNSSREESNTAIITPSAKQGILDKYKTTASIDMYEAFEEAARVYARNSGAAGIKLLSYNDKSLYKMELKIYRNRTTNRLLSSNNDYVFDVFDTEGLH